MTRIPRPILVLAVCLPAVAPAAATAATPTYPTVSRVSPLQLGLGDTLTVRGKHFRTGTGRNTVVFKRDGGRAVFVKAGAATGTQLKVKIPASMLTSLGTTAGKRIATRFRVRVLTARLGRHFTTSTDSPVISPAPRVAAGKPSSPNPGPAPVSVPAPVAGPAPVAQGAPQPQPATGCNPNLDANRCAAADPDTDNDGLPNSQDADDDGDRVTDATELQFGLDPLKADTDGDAVGDGFEFQSAIDLNSNAVPYPGKRPYPNPLDGQDAAVDFDGDGLNLTDEYQAWRYSGSPIALNYSDGSLYTGGKGPAVASGDVRDTDGSGFLSDDERDVDVDELGNWEEAHGRMTPLWWELSYQPAELVYPGRTFVATNFIDADTDGDTIKDGADDEDHDGFTNAAELRRPVNWQQTYVSTTHNGNPNPNTRARVNPFNPCKPFYSSTCHRYPPFNYYGPTEDWESPVRQDGP